jgi:hypothetical protein
MEKIFLQIPISAIVLLLFFSFGCIGAEAETEVVAETTTNDDFKQTEQNQEDSSENMGEDTDDGSSTVQITDFNDMRNIKCTYKLENSVGTNVMYIKDSDNIRLDGFVGDSKTILYVEGDTAYTYTVGSTGNEKGTTFLLENTVEPNIFDSLAKAKELYEQGNEDVVFECVPYTVTADDLTKPDIEYVDINELMKKMKEAQS